MLFEKASALADRMFDAASVPVDYLRGGVALAEGIPAKVGTQLFRIEDARTGLAELRRRTDFIVRRADLGGAEPQPRDVIAWRGAEYVVSAPAGEPCWRPHTRHGDNPTIRIHAEERHAQ